MNPRSIRTIFISITSNHEFVPIFLSTITIELLILTVFFDTKLSISFTNVYYFLLTIFVLVRFIQNFFREFIFIWNHIFVQLVYFFCCKSFNHNFVPRENLWIETILI